MLHIYVQNKILSRVCMCVLPLTFSVAIACEEIVKKSGKHVYLHVRLNCLG